MLLIVSFPVIIGLLLTKKRCQRGLWARLGKVPAELLGLTGPVVWVHAASLGEVTAIVPLLKAMKAEGPQQEFVVSTVTETGREMVINQLNGVATHCYAPVDVWWAVARYVRVLKPRVFLLVESEIWPNLLATLQKHQVPVCLVNGRISSRSFSRYRFVKRFMKRVWSCIDMALMQTTHDADRIKELGTRAHAVHVTGNMKFDQNIEAPKKSDLVPTLRASLKIKETEMVLVAGSTHSQEEEYLLEAFQSLLATHENVVLIMAPRHIERAGVLEQLIVQHGLPCVRRSQLCEEEFSNNEHLPHRVIILDSRGELPFVYSLGVVGFVGGTLVPIGGHNLLEPAQWGRPVVFGPYIDHCRDMAYQLLQAGGGIQIQQPEKLGECFSGLIEHPQDAHQMGKQALSVIQKNRGVVEKNIRMIQQLLKPAGSSTSHAGYTAPHNSRQGSSIVGPLSQSSATISS